MQRRDSLLSSSTDDLWSVVSLQDEWSDDLPNVAGVDYDDDDNDDDVATVAADYVQRRRDDLPLQLSTSATTTTTTTSTKSVKTKATRSVVRRNERERNRVKQVNQGFDRLRQYVRLPGGLSKKKLSKVDTLRAAVNYIRQLRSLLAEADGAAASAASFYVTEQLLPSQQQPQFRQQQQPHVHVGDVNNPSSGFFLSVLQTGINSSTESCDVTAAISGLLPTASTPLEPALCATYPTGSAWLPLADVNDNTYVITEPCSPWSPEADVIKMADASEQQRLSELTAWLME